MENTIGKETGGASGEAILNIALPKGRLGEKVYRLFAEAGFECPAILENSRKLIFENEKSSVRYFWVKPSDVPVYVERGAADIGVAGGKDQAILFKKGQIIRAIPQDEIIKTLKEEIEAF